MLGMFNPVTSCKEDGTKELEGRRENGQKKT